MEEVLAPLDLSPVTKRNYTNYWRALQKKTGLELSQFLEPSKTSPSELIKTIHEAEFNDGLRKNIFTCLCTVLREKNVDREPYVEELNREAGKYLKHREKNEKNTKEKKNWIELKELIEYYETKKELNIQSQTIEQATLMLGCYLEIPPVRNDWCSVKWQNYDKENDNYMENGCLYLNKYKTVKKRGKMECELPSSLQELIKIYLEKQTKEENDFLFISPQKKQAFSKSNFSKTLVRHIQKKYPEKRVNINMLRKLFVSNETFESIEKSKVVANIMGHSFIEHFRYHKRQ